MYDQRWSLTKIIKEKKQHCTKKCNSLKYFNKQRTNIWILIKWCRYMRHELNLNYIRISITACIAGFNVYVVNSYTLYMYKTQQSFFLC